MTIPRIIHQTARDYENLPDEIRQNLENIKLLNPRWEHRFYADQDLFDYVDRNFGQRVRRAVRLINPNYGAVLADLFRYLVMFREGGVYLDIKSTLTRPLDEVLMEDDVYLLSQRDNRLGRPHGGLANSPELIRVPGGEFEQWHIVAAPRHPFLDRVVKDVLFNIEQYNSEWFGVGMSGVMRVAGPICYTLAIAPLRFRQRHRFVDLESLGFRYTIYDTITHHMSLQTHYSQLSEPIILN